MKQSKTTESTLTQQHDAVQHPAHYTRGSIECWDFLLGYNPDFLRGNVVKYLVRYQHKNGLEDLKKADAYLRKYTSTCVVHCACRVNGAVNVWEYGLSLDLPPEAIVIIDILLRGGDLAVTRILMDRLLLDNQPTDEAQECVDGLLYSSTELCEDPAPCTAASQEE